MPTTCTLGVEGVNDSILKRTNGRFHKAGLVKRIGVNRHLHIKLVGHGQAMIDRARRGAPVFVKFQPHRTRNHLLAQCLVVRGVTLPHKAKIHRKSFCRFEHSMNIPSARRTSRRIGASRRTCAAADHCGDATSERLVNLLWADEVDVRIKSASCQDMPFCCDHLSARTDHHALRHSSLN